MTLDAPLKSAQRRADPVDMWTTLRLAHIPTGEQNQKKRTYDVLPKPDNFIRYRQKIAERVFLFRLPRSKLALTLPAVLRTVSTPASRRRDEDCGQ